MYECYRNAIIASIFPVGAALLARAVPVSNGQKGGGD